MDSVTNMLESILGFLLRLLELIVGLLIAILNLFLEFARDVMGLVS